MRKIMIFASLSALALVAAPPAHAQLTPTAAPAPAVEPEAGPRFRWGISGFGGKYFVNGTGGGIGGIDARFGVQIDEMIGVYASPILLVGAGAQVSSGATSASTSMSAVALYGVGLLGDLTFGNLLYVAAGPELLYGAAAQAATQADQNGASASASAEAGTYLGLEARVGVALGSMRPHRRKAFTIGLDLHAIFTTKATFTPLLALGYDAF